jgi:hypothetical protein
MLYIYIHMLLNTFKSHIDKKILDKIEIMKTSSNRMIFSDYFNQYLKGTNPGRSSMWIYIYNLFLYLNTVTVTTGTFEP